MAVEPQTTAADLTAYNQAVQAEALHPLWLSDPSAMVREPRLVGQPYRWQWTAVRRRLLEAAALLPVGGAGTDRRVLGLKNPALAMSACTTHTLAAAFQMV